MLLLVLSHGKDLEKSALRDHKIACTGSREVAGNGVQNPCGFNDLIEEVHGRQWVGKYWAQCLSL